MADLIDFLLTFVDAALDGKRGLWSLFLAIVLGFLMIPIGILFFRLCAKFGTGDTTTAFLFFILIMIPMGFGYFLLDKWLNRRFQA